jgi:Berberine and berberine like
VNRNSKGLPVMIVQQDMPPWGEAYGPNYEALVVLKNKYDPTNFFRMNHNIKSTL